MYIFHRYILTIYKKKHEQKQKLFLESNFLLIIKLIFKIVI